MMLFMVKVIKQECSIFILSKIVSDNFILVEGKTTLD